jgi:uncharacterized membrane protein YidH (DUF202 family)
LSEKVAPGRIVAAVAFALIALAFFAAGVVLAVTPADQLPGFLGPDSTSNQHHTLRGIGSLLVGLVFTAAAWFAARYQSLALEEARAAEAARVAGEPAAEADAPGPEAGKASEPAA